MCAESRAPGNQPRVRACQDEDLKELRAILEASPEAATWSTRGLQEAFRSHGAYFLIGRYDDEIAGFISGRRVADEAEIWNLAIRPENRRQGLGRKLVETLVEIFRGEGVNQVFLEVRQSNLNAISFYEKLGFRQVGRREGYYREPEEAAIVLALRTGPLPKKH